MRIEFGDGLYNEANQPPVQLFNDYFAGGMSGIVFQELREARALAYAVGAVYSNGGRKGEQNVMIGRHWLPGGQDAGGVGCLPRTV